MTEEIIYKQIANKDLKKYGSLMVPMIYEELSREESIETEYLALGAWIGDKPIAAIVADPEERGDLNILSVWTDQEYRRQGVATDLFSKLLQVASGLYQWDELEYGDDIEVKTMYCLENDLRRAFDLWLESVGFSEFNIMRDAEGDRPETCGATAELHLFRYGL